MIVRMSQLEDECDRLRAELDQQTKNNSSGSGASGSGSNEDELIVALRSEVNDLRKLLAAKEKDACLVDELRLEMAELRETGLSDGAIATASDEKLREQLELANCEIMDLRSQNEVLNQQVTRLQINTAPHGHMPHLGQEGMTWEERKKLLLQQLDAEMDDNAPAQEQTKRVEIEDVIKTTDAELARRDREIAELRSLLEQQADARGDVAVGAAAVQQLIESDELVQEEREKLRALQKSWDEKLRQAEIDLSMERAKMARERLQLEEQKQKLEELLNAAQSSTGDGKDKAVDAKGRKWLSRLGLKDET